MVQNQLSHHLFLELTCFNPFILWSLPLINFLVSFFTYLRIFRFVSFLPLTSTYKCCLLLFPQRTGKGSLARTMNWSLLQSPEIETNVIDAINPQKLNVFTYHLKIVILFFVKTWWLSLILQNMCAINTHM